MQILANVKNLDFIGVFLFGFLSSVLEIISFFY